MAATTFKLARAGFKRAMEETAAWVLPTVRRNYKPICYFVNHADKSFCTLLYAEARRPDSV